MLENVDTSLICLLYSVWASHLRVIYPVSNRFNSFLGNCMHACRLSLSLTKQLRLEAGFLHLITKLN